MTNHSTNNRYINDYTQFFFLLLGISIVCVLFLPNVFQKGLFSDGILYATIAKNMAHQNGDILHPICLQRDGWFFSHPPMHFFCESLFFRFFGDMFWVEKVYCLFTFFLSLLTVWHLLKLLLLDRKIILPHFNLFIVFIVLWPIVIWVVKYNTIENTMQLFSLLAVYFFLSFCIQKQRNFSLYLMGVLCLLLGCFSKGLPALFPLSVFILDYGVRKETSFKKAMLFTLLTLLVLASVIAILYYFNSDAGNYMREYYTVQITGSFKQKNMNTMHLGYSYILFAFLQQSAIVVIVSILLFIIFKGRTETVKSSRNVAFFLCLGVLSFLPFILSPKQNEYYLFPCCFYISIALALFFAPKVETLFNAKRMAISWLIIPVGLLFITIGYSITKYGDNERDNELLQVIEKTIVQNKGNCNINVEDYMQFSANFYLLRYYDMEYVAPEHANFVLIATKGNHFKIIPSNR